MLLSQTFQVYDDATNVPARSHLVLATNVSRGLGADKATIAANGTDVVTFHYASATNAGPHAWTINGQATSETALLDPASGLYWSSVEVTAGTPTVPYVGPIEVTVGGETLTVQAV